MDYSQYIKENSEKINEEHIREVISKEKELKTRVENICEEDFDKRKHQINLMMEWLKEISGSEGKDKFDRKKRNMVALALLYFIKPVDLIPDFIPLIGYIDDMAILNNVW